MRTCVVLTLLPLLDSVHVLVISCLNIAEMAFTIFGDGP